MSIQSAMLVALGFLAAALLSLLIAPAFWARAVRLTTNRIKDSMPLTELEIRADKDRIRAEYAIKVHRLESRMEQVRLAGARQQIELNRRDARINEVEAELERLRAAHEETQNARRVLEQTVADRLPRVEQRLGEAKQQLFTRDQEIGELTRTGDRQTRALAEAQAINAQQASEIERLSAALATRAARNQEGLADPRFDGEVALRAEIEALRAKTREQAQLLARLQSAASRPNTAPVEGQAAVSGAAQPAGAPTETLELAAQKAEHERQLRVLKARNEDQSGEITRLKAALAVFEGEVDQDPRMSLRESRIGLKARAQSLEAQNTQLTDTVHRVRSELAAANERAARQAAHFTAELKRLGAGTLPASGQARRTPEPARMTLAERVAQARAAAPVTTGGSAAAPANGNHNGDGDGEVGEGKPQPPLRARVVAVSQTAEVDTAGEAVAPEPVVNGRDGAAGQPAVEAGREARPRLLDRIAGVGRSS